MSKKIYGFKKNKCAEPLNVLLWSNPNPTETMGKTDIELASDDFDMYEVFYKIKNNSSTLQSVKSIKGYNCLLTSTNGYENKAISREMFWGTDKIVTEVAYAGSTTEANNYLIPVYIIGYKTGLFE
jgi:hypothetical protein